MQICWIIPPRGAVMISDRQRHDFYTAPCCSSHWGLRALCCCTQLSVGGDLESTVERHSHSRAPVLQPPPAECLTILITAVTEPAWSNWRRTWSWLAPESARCPMWGSWAAGAPTWMTSPSWEDWTMSRWSLSGCQYFKDDHYFTKFCRVASMVSNHCPTSNTVKICKNFSFGGTGSAHWGKFSIWKTWGSWRTSGLPRTPVLMDQRGHTFNILLLLWHFINSITLQIQTNCDSQPATAREIGQHQH